MKKNYILFLFMGIQSLAFSQWEAFEIGFSSPLNIWDMDAVDENTVWAITTDGTYSGDAWNISTSSTFAMTADGGTTWTIGDLPFPNTSWSGWMVTAIDANTAWVAASNPFVLGAAIYKTEDGGETWIQQNIFSSSSFCTNIHFWDANEGVAIGNVNGGIFEIYTTTDGGENWIQVDGANIPTPVNNSEFVSTSVSSVTGDNIWFGTRFSRVFHSPDRGLTWTASTTPISSLTSNPWVEGVAFKDELVGVAHSADYSSQPYQYLLAVTEDGGATWSQQTVTNNDFSIFNAQYVGEALLITSRATNGAGPYVTSYSFDNGVSWTEVETGTPIMDFEFLDSETGWAGKFKNNNDPTQMYKYTGEVITNIFSPNELEVQWSLSPNPSSDFVNLHILSPNPMDLIMELYTTNGQMMSRRDLGTGAEFRETIDLRNLPVGFYQAVIRDETGALVSKNLIKN